MCGRFDNLIAREAYRTVYRALRLPQSNFPPRYNIAPTDQIPIVRIDPRDGTRELTMARWGLIPSSRFFRIPSAFWRASASDVDGK